MKCDAEASLFSIYQRTEIVNHHMEIASKEFPAQFYRSFAEKNNRFFNKKKIMLENREIQRSKDTENHSMSIKSGYEA